MSSRRSSMAERPSNLSVAAEEGQYQLPPARDDKDSPPSRCSDVSAASQTSQISVVSQTADLKAASRSQLLDSLTTMAGCSRPDTWAILVEIRTVFQPVRLMNFLLARYTRIHGCSYEADDDVLFVDDANGVSDAESISTVMDRLVILDGYPEGLTVKAAVLLFVDRWVEWFPLDFLPYSEVGNKLLKRLLSLLRIVREEDFPTIVTDKVFEKAYPQLNYMLAPLTAQTDSTRRGSSSTPSIHMPESTDVTIEIAHAAVVKYCQQLHGLRFHCTVDPAHVEAVHCTAMERKLACAIFTSIKRSIDNVYEWYNDVALSLAIAECAHEAMTVAPPTADKCRLNTLYDKVLFAKSGHTVERLYTFARMVPLQPPTANTKRGTFRSRMTLGRKLRGLSREPSYDEAGGSVKAQSITDIDALDVAEQLTLRLHYLYCSVPSDQMLHDMHSSPELTRFRAESERLQCLFVNHVLLCPDVKERADRVVHLMDVVDRLMEIRSFHAVMLIVMALQSTPIHRLKHTWAHVEMEHPNRWEGMHRSIGLGGQHLVSKTNEILTNDPACKLEMDCPRQAAINMSLVPLQPSLSRQVTEELLMRPTDAAEDDDDSYDEEDGMDSGDAFSNSALRKVAREVLSREGSSRLHTHTPTRQSVDEDTSAEARRLARIEKLKSIVTRANIVPVPSTPPSLSASTSMDSLSESCLDVKDGHETPTLQASRRSSMGIAIWRSPTLDRTPSGHQSQPVDTTKGNAHQFFPSSGQSMDARRVQGVAKPAQAEPPANPPKRRGPVLKVPPPMIAAYSFPIPMMPYIYGYTRMLMQFKELPAYVVADPEEPNCEPFERLNVSRLRKISSIMAALKSCQLTPFQFKARPEIQQILEGSPKWVDEDSQWTRSIALEPLQTPSTK